MRRSRNKRANLIKIILIIVSLGLAIIIPTLYCLLTPVSESAPMNTPTAQSKKKKKKKNKKKQKSSEPRAEETSTVETTDDSTPHHPADEDADFSAPITSTEPVENGTEEGDTPEDASSVTETPTEAAPPPADGMPTLGGIPYCPTTEITYEEMRIATYYEHLQTNEFKTNTSILHLSPHELMIDVRHDILYRHMRPTIRQWIEKAYRDNPRHITYLGRMNGLSPIYTLYKSPYVYENGKSGYTIINRENGIFIIPLNASKADDAWQYTKEPAINPHTGKAWIRLHDDEARQVAELGIELTEEERQYLQDVQDILNENFHYFYGMAYVRPDEMGMTVEQLIGRRIPRKALIFGKRTKLLYQEHYTPQQCRLYSILGHPVYQFNKLDTWKRGGGAIGSHCKSSHITGLGDTFDYFISTVGYNYCNLDEYGDPLNDEGNPNVADARENVFSLSNYYTVQLEGCKFFFDMIKNFKSICEAKRVNLHRAEDNTTPLQLTLYYLYKRTELYCNTIMLHIGALDREEITPKGELMCWGGFGAHSSSYGSEIPRHYKRLSEQIALPGEPGTGSSIWEESPTEQHASDN